MQSAYIHLYLIIINIITFALYGLDKWRAMTRQWRIREKKLIGLALIGGSIGAMIGMTVFHHKTRKWYSWNLSITDHVCHTFYIEIMIPKLFLE